MQAMTTNASSTEEQLANLVKMMEGLTRHVQHQDSRIDKLMDKVEGLLDGESSHAPGKGILIQEADNPVKQAPTIKKLLVSTEGTIPLDQLKEFIEGTIKDKYEISTRSPICILSLTLRGLIASECLLVINPPNFSNSKAKEIQSSMLHTLWRHVIMLGPMETISSNSSSVP